MKALSFLLLAGALCCGNLGFAAFSEQEFHFGQEVDIIPSHLSYDAQTQAWAETTLMRQEAPKIFIKLAERFKLSPPLPQAVSCNFSDLSFSSLSDTSRLSIQEACTKGIFKGTYGKFYPHAYFTNAEAITSLIRISDGVLSEQHVLHWSEPYYQKARQR